MSAAACESGHGPLIWSRNVPMPTNKPMAIAMAAGAGTLMQWFGCCSRCGTPVEWSSDRPEPAPRQFRRGSFSPTRSRKLFQTDRR